MLSKSSDTSRGKKIDNLTRWGLEHPCTLVGDPRELVLVALYRTLVVRSQCHYSTVQMDGRRVVVGLPNAHGSPELTCSAVASAVVSSFPARCWNSGTGTHTACAAPAPAVSRVGQQLHWHVCKHRHSTGCSAAATRGNPCSSGIWAGRGTAGVMAVRLVWTFSRRPAGSSARTAANCHSAHAPFPEEMGTWNASWNNVSRNKNRYF